MKKTSLILSLSVASLLLTSVVLQAADKPPVTITGMGQCAKCSLKQADACQNAVVVEEGDKKITYLLEQNEISKKFHSNLCQAQKKVTAVGALKEVEGKKVLTVTKLELVTN